MVSAKRERRVGRVAEPRRVPKRRATSARPKASTRMRAPAKLEPVRAFARLAAIVESTDDAVIGANLKGVITDWNGGALALFGYPAAEAIGRSVQFLVPPDRADEVPQLIDRAARGEAVRDFETARVRKDGHRVFISLTQSPILDASGHAVGFSTIARDMSERIRAEDALLESDRRYRELVEGLPVAIFRTAADGRILDVNPSCVRMLGYPDRRSFLHRNSSIFYADIEDFNKYTRILLQTGSVASVELRLRKADGSFMWVLGSARTQVDDNGRVLSYVGIFEDISERVRLETATQRVSALQDLVIRVLGHDLKGPIGVIQGYLELIEAQVASAPTPENVAQVRDSLRKASEAAANMLLQLANARAISRLTMNALEAPAGEIVDLGRMCREVVAMLRPLADAKDQDLVVDATNGVRARLSPGFESVISNLASNAIKYSPNGSTVGVRLVESNGTVVLSVSDEGPGVPLEARAKIFRKFERLDKGQSVDGHGLGLSIVASLVELSRGTIAVTDRPDGHRGSIFRVEIPTAPGRVPS